MLRIVRALCLRLTPFPKRAAEAAALGEAEVGVARAVVARAVEPADEVELVGVRVVAQAVEVELEAARAGALGGVVERAAGVAREERAAATAEW